MTWSLLDPADSAYVTLSATGKVTVTKAEAIKTSISYPTRAGIDDMNLLDLDVAMAPGLLNWWINRWGNSEATFETAIDFIKEKDIEQQFQGKESAYMLFYRKSQLRRPPEGMAR